MSEPTDAELLAARTKRLAKEFDSFDHDAELDFHRHAARKRFGLQKPRVGGVASKAYADNYDRIFRNKGADHGSQDR